MSVDPLAPGFRAAGVSAGIKSSGDRDVALIVNDGPSFLAAGVFTTNRIQAAPVTWSREVVKDGTLRAVAMNSGGANACTGPDGFLDTHRSAEHVADLLGCGAIDVAVCSTGLIGVRLPMPALISGLTQAHQELAAGGGVDAARAIMTTDSVPKTARARSDDGWTVAGMAKGAGMLAPGLATMLVVITTDAFLPSQESVDAVLRKATERTFDRLDSDGAMSTNDTVLLMASGASATAANEAEFTSLLERVCADLARQLLADAEGASKEIDITVVNAASEADALAAGRAVARSNLFKCAIHGEDPNWGRVISAVGTTSATFDPAEIAVSINGVWVCRNGTAAQARELVDLSPRQVDVVVDLGAGGENATILTNDLTAAYVHENSAYSS